MPLPASGSIALSQIATEFGGSAPHTLTEYYRGGSLVPNTAHNAAIPTSGAIKLTDFYGGNAFVPQTVTRTSGTGATETAPAGATNVIIAVWAGGGSGGQGLRTAINPSGYDGTGAGSGGYSQSTYAISGGQTLTYTVGGGGAPSGVNGVASSVSSGTKTITTMAANPGTGGNPSAAPVNAAGTGGTASGGNTSNVTGNSGLADAFAGASAVIGWNGNSGGSGGDGGAGGSVSNNPGVAGGGGKIIFYYT